MRFYYTFVFASFSLLLAGASFARGPADLESRFAAQLDSHVEMQVGMLVSQRLAEEVQALRVPSALPAPSPVRHASAVASATSARALPNGELTATQLACAVQGPGVVQCSVQQSAGSTALVAIQGR
jgi:hypothetical protein